MRSPIEAAEKLLGYEYWLKNAVGRLQEGLKGPDSFGRAEGGVEFQGEIPTEKFDHRYWMVVRDGGKKSLLLLPGKSPSRALDAMFDGLDSWRLDCAQFIQIAHLYAQRKTLGAKEFDAKVHGMEFELKPQRSTGLATARGVYDRKSKNAVWEFFPGQGETLAKDAGAQCLAKTTEELVAEAPIGSRVAWTNGDSKADGTAYKHENALKMGPDAFAGHPFGTITRRALELLLAKQQRPGTKTADDPYVRENIFLSQIEHYRKPTA